MIVVEVMENKEAEELLAKLNYGHLACARDNQPYIVPIHYAYIDSHIYIYTTEGRKSYMIQENPHVCLQVEEIIDKDNWKSVIVTGEAHEVKKREEREKALTPILRANPTLTPARSIRWMDEWIRENVEFILRINPKAISGRSTVLPATNAEFVTNVSRPQIL
jgi:nitroimidazol reductase NimA-like FMN-containing flavoprotein (pyridoxamine 5'-phosphate oxidase superfamily)